MTTTAGALTPRPPGRPASASKAEVLAVATKLFLQGERLDVQAIATELGVSRATIYRWYGSREGLLGTVLASEFERRISAADAACDARGATRLLIVIERVVREIAEHHAMQRYFENEPTSAFRILTSSGGIVQPRAVSTIEKLLDRVIDEDGYRPSIERSTLAYTLVRLGEAFLYNDAAAGLRGDIDRAAEVLVALLRTD